jgi:hypothetical protein
MLSELTIQSDSSPKSFVSVLLQELNSLRAQPERPIGRIIDCLESLKSGAISLAGLEIKEFVAEEANLLANHLREIIRNKILLEEINEVD